jgi:hypothetical protein
MGSMASLVRPGMNGSLFEPGDASALLQTSLELWADDERLRALGDGARQTFEECYTEEKNHDVLMQIYREAGAKDVEQEAVENAKAEAMLLAIARCKARRLQQVVGQPVN